MNKKKKKTLWWIIPLMVILALAGLLTYFRDHPVAVKAAAVDLTKVHTTKVMQGTINTTVSTTGAVRTNQTTSLAWKTSGQVGQVLVKLGDPVQAGQVLAKLDPTSNINFTVQQANLLTAQENLAALQDRTTAVATGKIALIQAQASVANAQKAVDALQVTPSQAQIDAAYAVTLQDQKTVDKLQVAFNILAGNPVTDINRANALNALNNATQKQNLDLGAYNQLVNHKPDAAALATAQSNLSVAQQQLAVAQANATLANAGPDQSKIAAAQASIQQIQATLDQQNIVASGAGTVTGISVQAGDLVKSGTAALQIDDMSSLYMDVQVSESNIASVQPGQTVDLSFAAISNRTYPGQVTAIGTTGSVSGGVANFTVTVLLMNTDSQVRPGMTATATIVTNQLSNALLVPNLSIATLNGKKVVYVMAGGQVSPVDVSQSLVSDAKTAVVGANLKAGDAVVANPASLAAPAEKGLTSLFLKLGVIVIS